MSKVRKLVCMLLALVMVLALAVPAFAAMDETLECPLCKHAGGHTVINGSVILAHSYITVGSCLNYHANHQHTQLGQYRQYRCPACGNPFYEFVRFAGVTCPYGSL